MNNVTRRTPLLTAVALLGLCVAAHAQPSPVRGRIVWLKGDHVYIALADTSAPGSGALLTFVERGKTIARGEVAREVDGEILVVKVYSGTLSKVKKLERVQILAEIPPVLAPTLLRVGCPGASRANLLFGCDPMEVLAPSTSASYRAGTAERSYRWIRGSAPEGTGPWPDTLEVRPFDDIADEEIALERGEIDAAIFWPGEVSTHLRELPVWQDHLFGTRARGVVAALGLDLGAKRDSSALAAMNQDLFQGDLAAWPTVGGMATTARAQAPRFQVDPSCPGAPLLERYLGYSRGTPSGSGEARTVRVFYLDAPVDTMARLALAVTRYARANAATKAQLARADSLEAWLLRAAAGTAPSSDALQTALRDGLGATLVFAIRCPVLSAPRLRPYLAALGADTLVNMLRCSSIDRP